MEVAIIPWRIFFESLKEQEASTFELWLRRWLFANEGVILADHGFAPTD